MRVQPILNLNFDLIPLVTSSIILYNFQHLEVLLIPH